MLTTLGRLFAGAALLTAAALPAYAQISNDTVRLVVLNDQSSAYSDT